MRYEAARWMVTAMTTASLAAAQSDIPHDILSTQASNRATGHANKIVTLGQGENRKTHVVWHDYTPDPGGTAVGPGWQSRRNSTAMARTYDHTTQIWSETTVIGPGVDNHNNPALASDSRGVLHVVYGAHASPLLYRHSLQPNDTSAWTDEMRFGEGCTYPNLVIDAEDTLHVTCRDRVPPKPGSNWCLNYYRKKVGQPWERVATLVDSGRVDYTNFHNRLAIDANDRLHLAYYVYRPDLVGGDFVGYMCSDDHGNTWRSAGDTALDLPRVYGSLGEADTIVHGADTRVLAPVLTTDGQGRPCVLAVHCEKPRWYPVLYRHDGQRWNATDLTPVLDTYFEGHSGTGRLSSSADGTVWILLANGRPGRQTTGFVLLRIKPGETQVHTVGVRRWSSAGDQPNWRPRIERQVGHNPVELPAILYLHGPNGGNQEHESYNETHFVHPDWIAAALLHNE